MSDYLKMPDNLPQPNDDGACNYLQGMHLPSVLLVSTDGGMVDLSTRTSHYTVVYVYPMIAKPGVALPESWDMIPGARGCTPQSCNFRDHHHDLQKHNAEIFGLSSQSTQDQKEAVSRLHLPFPLLSDPDLKCAQALRLPTFEIDKKRLLKRVTLIISKQRIVKTFYPVFPPNQSAEMVVDWLHCQ